MKPEPYFFLRIFNEEAEPIETAIIRAQQRN